MSHQHCISVSTLSTGSLCNCFVSNCTGLRPATNSKLDGALVRYPTTAAASTSGAATCRRTEYYSVRRVQASRRALAVRRRAKCSEVVSRHDPDPHFHSDHTGDEATDYVDGTCDSCRRRLHQHKRATPARLRRSSRCTSAPELDTAPRYQHESDEHTTRPWSVLRTYTRTGDRVPLPAASPTDHPQSCHVGHRDDRDTDDVSCPVVCAGLRARAWDRHTARLPRSDVLTSTASCGPKRSVMT